MTPALVLEEYDIIGRTIPNELILETRERFRQLESDGVHPWRILLDEVILEAERIKLPKVEQKISEDRLWIAQACAEVMLEKINKKIGLDHLSWTGRLAEMRNAVDFFKLFTVLDLSKEEWGNSAWLVQNGTDLNVRALYRQVVSRFGSFANFKEWLTGVQQEPSYTKIVFSWLTPKDAFEYFNSIEITEQKWRNSGWLQKNAKCSKKEGGIGLNLCGLYDAIKSRFGGYFKFIAWMDGNNTITLTPEQVVSSWKDPQDALSYFQTIGLNNQEWRRSSWLYQNGTVLRPEAVPYINLASLCSQIRTRFGSHPKFIAWMDGKETIAPSFKEVVESWKVPTDAIAYFESLGVKVEQWRSSHWLINNAKYSKEQGGIGINLNGLATQISNRFQRFSRFITWLDGKETITQSFNEIVKSWQSASDAIEYFSLIGIYDESWRNSNWLQRLAKHTIKKSGNQIGLSGLCAGINNRFGGHKIFLACMDGHLPFNGLTSPKEAQECLRQEILRLRTSGMWIQAPTDDNQITPAEWGAIAQEFWYKKNPVVRAVTDYLHSLEG